MREPRLRCPAAFCTAVVVVWIAVLATLPASADTGTSSPQAARGPTPTVAPPPPPPPSPSPSGPDAAATSETPAASEVPSSPAGASPATDAPSPTSLPDPDLAQRRRQTTTVGTTDDAFRPTRITVDFGATVSWTNSGQNPHTVTADDGSFGSGTLQNGDTFSRSFTAAGTFAYHCRFHGGPGGSGMSGVVIVLAADTGGAVTGDGGPTEVDSVGDLPATGLDRPAALPASVVLAVLGIASVALGRRPARRIG